MRSTIILMSVPKNYVYILDVQLCIAIRPISNLSLLASVLILLRPPAAHIDPQMLRSTLGHRLQLNLLATLLRTHWLRFYFARSTIKWNRIGKNGSPRPSPTSLTHQLDVTLHNFSSPGHVLCHMLIKMWKRGRKRERARERKEKRIETVSIEHVRSFVLTHITSSMLVRCVAAAETRKVA